MTAFQASVRSTARSTLAPELSQTQHLDLPLHPQQSVEGKNVHTTSQHWSTPAHLFDSVNPSSLKTKKKLNEAVYHSSSKGSHKLHFPTKKKKAFWHSSVLLYTHTHTHTHTNLK